MVPRMLLFVVIGVALADQTFPSSSQCTTFCTTYQGDGTASLNCSSTYDIYSTMDACMKECSRFPITSTCATPGCAQAAGENSYDCRLYHLMVATSASANLPIHCPHATPLSSEAESNSPNTLSQCVDTPSATDQPLAVPIQDLCNNLVATCGMYFGAQGPLTMEYCYNAMYFVPAQNDLSGYPMGGSGFPVATPASDDTFICRRYHVDVAGNSSDLAAIHCPHAFTGDAVCGTSCNYYCDLIQGACLSGNAQFTSTSACMTACNGYATAAFTSALPTTGNTLNCRIYHATVAAQSPDNAVVHCPHAGMVSTPEYCGSGAFTVSASLFLVALLAFFSLN